MLIDKNNLPVVAQDFMNEVHVEDVDIINELYENILSYENEQNETNKEIVTNTYEKWFEHTVNHFKGEEDKMLELNFPPYMMHKGEHDNCLRIMDEVLRNFKNTSDVNTLKTYLENDLLNWLINHIQTMDTITAQFFSTGLSPCQAS